MSHPLKTFSGNPLYPKRFKKENTDYFMQTERIKLEDGKQRELIAKAKKRSDTTWKALSDKSGVCEGYLKNELRKERRALRADVYYKLEKLSGENYGNRIVGILDKNWAKQKAEKILCLNQ